MPGLADPGAMEKLKALLAAGTKPTVPQTFDAYFSPQTFGRGWQTDWNPKAPAMPDMPTAASQPAGTPPPATESGGNNFLERMQGAGGFAEGFSEMGPLGFLAGLFGHMFKTDENPLTEGLNALGSQWGMGTSGGGGLPGVTGDPAAVLQDPSNPIAAVAGSKLGKMLKMGALPGLKI